jgi:hypothetical protein
LKITITSDLVQNRVNENAAFSVTANFYSDAWAATSPTSARYRIDNPDSDTEIVGWQTLSPATSNTITVTGVQNAVVCDSSRDERRQLTVEATHASTTWISTKDWWIKNLSGIRAA